MSNLGRAGRIPAIMLITAVLATLLGCKLSDKASTESFRATKKDFWIFGKERTAMLLHQFVIDNSQSVLTANIRDPSLRSLQPIKACWYPLENETSQIKPYLDQNQISALYDLAPTPVTDHAVPMDQLLLAIEKVPELRSINDSFKKASTRMLVNMPIDTGIDLAICSLGVGTAAALALPTVGISTSVIPWIIGACGIGMGFSGAFDAVKEPIKPGINYVADRAAGAVGEALDDTQGRRKAITERLPIALNSNGEITSYVESSVAEMPEIGWDEMQRLQELVRNLGSSRSNAYPDGTPKNFNQRTQCQTIPILKNSGKFFAPDMENFSREARSQLRGQGYTESEIRELESKTLTKRQLQ